MATIVTETEKRSVACPHCNARKGRPCVSSRQPGANTFGGGWGGPPDLDRAHDARRAAFLASKASKRPVRDFVIENTSTGIVFGVYEAENFDGALRAMFAVAGEPFETTTWVKIVGLSEAREPTAHPDLRVTALDTIEGRKAIRYARELGSLVTLCKAADPTEGARAFLSRDEAEEVCSVDPSLIRLVRAGA